MKKIILTVLVLIFSALVFKYSINKYKEYNEKENIRNILVNAKHDNIFFSISDRMKKEFSKVKNGKNYKKADDIKKLLVFNFAGGLGDKFSALRIQMAAKNLGWEIVVIGGLAPVDTSPEIEELNKKLIDFINPDFVVSQYPVGINPRVQNYIVVHFIPDQSEEEISRVFNITKDYSGILYVSENMKFLELIKQKYSEVNKKLYWKPFYFSIPKNQFKEDVIFDKMVMYGDRWDYRRSGEDFSYLFKMLDEDKIVDYYGFDKSWKMYSSYKGFLPYEYDKLMDALRDSGISLVIHSGFHHENNFPSSRIFEAIGASTIVISDDISFVKDHFADKVLYIDPTLKGKDLYAQVRKHYDWIKNNPEKAKNMAREAHKILNDTLTLEQQLLKIDELHNEVTNAK